MIMKGQILRDLFQWHMMLLMALILAETLHLNTNLSTLVDKNSIAGPLQRPRPLMRQISVSYGTDLFTIA